MINNQSNHLFDQVKSIVTKRNKLDRDYIESHYIGSLMIRRWLSFIFNDYKYEYFDFLNRLNYNYFDDKYEDYLFLYNVFPSGLSGFSFKGAYIKKISKTPTKTEERSQNILDVLSQGLDISKKDAKLIMIQENFNNDLFKEV